MTYNYSFSGTDVKAYASNIEGENFHQLKALSTISIQVNEQKSPVRRLGRQHVTGFTRSIKTVAGTMVFVILNDHPLKGLIANGNLYLNSRHVLNDINQKYQSTNILPFNLKLIYQTEHATNNTAEINVYGIEIISQSIVTSSNDMVTELVIQFLAKDYKEFYHSGLANQELAENTINVENEYIRQEDTANQKSLKSIYNEQDTAEQNQSSYPDSVSYKETESVEQGYQNQLSVYARVKEFVSDQKILDDYWGNQTDSNNVTKSQRIQGEDIFRFLENPAGKLIQENAQALIRAKQQLIKELENRKLNLLTSYHLLKLYQNAKPQVLQAYENNINFIKEQLQKLRII